MIMRRFSVQPRGTHCPQAQRERTVHRLTRRHFIAGGVVVAAFGAARALGATHTPAPLPQAIRVHLFSGLGITRVQISGIAPLELSIGTATREMTALTYDGVAGTLTGDLTNLTLGDAPVVVRSAAPLLVSASTAANALPPRHYGGTITLQRSGSAALVVNAIDVESYVASTLASESSPSWALESVKAQAIVSRTYGLRAAVHSTARPYDVTDDTSNQVYEGLDNLAPVFTSAAAATAGMMITAGGAPADVFYSAVCGGHTAGSNELTGRPGPPYLYGISDTDDSGKPYCTPAPYFAWENAVPSQALSRVIGDFADIIVTDRWTDGRAKTVRIVRPATSADDMDGHQFYTQVSSVLGYKVLPSAMFDVKPSTEGYVFTGHGLGHGVGMCQWGARGRANAGIVAAPIVAAYFPGTVLVNPSLH